MKIVDEVKAGKEQFAELVESFRVKLSKDPERSISIQDINGFDITLRCSKGKEEKVVSVQVTLYRTSIMTNDNCEWETLVDFLTFISDATPSPHIKQPLSKLSFEDGARQGLQTNRCLVQG